jgi:hypothetical protein
VLLHEGELLVIDQSLALDRALVGMQFAVNDQERNRKSTPDWGNWKNAWGGMIESYAESWISEMPMTLLTGTSVFLEEDLCQAYPSSEVCDAIIRSDSTFVLFEVCSSRLTIKTTAHGSVDAFEIDTERVIHDKVSQLHATARNIINNEPALTGQTPTPDVAIRPVLVLANPFPLNPIIKNEFIDKPIQALHFLSGPGVHKLAIIDLEELEMLVGFHEQGHSMVEIIGRWQDSELRDWPLRNYVASQRALKKKVERPERIRISTESIFDGLATRLGFDISDYRSEQA